MQLIYQDTDITRQAKVLACTFLDTVGEADTLDITFDDSAEWFRWEAQPDDRIAVYEDGYATGTLYVNAVLPEDGKFRVIASGVKCAGREKLHRAYYGKTVSELFRIAARECGAEAALYGTKGENIIPFALQENETGVAMLARVCRWERIALKATQGRLIGIDCDWAQQRPAVKTVRLSGELTGIRYERTDMKRLKGVKVTSVKTEVAATDTATAWTNTEQDACLPAENSAQAGRWARGILWWHNLGAETIRMESGFDGGLTAMARVDVTGGTEMDGHWLVREARHDFIDRKTAAVLCRCVETIR